jgi:hypothetical protein
LARASRSKIIDQIEMKAMACLWFFLFATKEENRRTLFAARHTMGVVGTSFVLFIFEFDNICLN